MKIEYPQIDWKKIAKECPMAAHKLYVDIYNSALSDYPVGTISAQSLRHRFSRKPYEVTVWMHSIGVYAYTQGSFGTWRACCNNFVVNDGTNCTPNSLTYQENLAIAIEKGFEVIEDKIERKLISQSTIEKNRTLFLKELRSGNYKKGCIKSDENGNPVIKTKEDNDGYCSCAIMVKLFGGDKFSLPKAVRALGITNKDCRYIQLEINDTDLTFSEQADKIEKLFFV